MIKIRLGMFETNSSSAHSIVLAKQGKCNDTLKADKDGIIRIEANEFGWEIRNYQDAYTKASYCLTYAKQSGDEEMVELLRKVIQEHTGAKAVEFIPYKYTKKYISMEWGYIDHQSGPGECGAGNMVFDSEKNLKRFIFNPNSVLHTDNDNH